jgi:hypothetical protein
VPAGYGPPREFRRSRGGELRERLFAARRRDGRIGHHGAQALEKAMSESPTSLRALAHKCRCLAIDGGMDNVAAALNEIAHDYDRQADRIEKAEAKTRERLASRAKLNGD